MLTIPVRHNLVLFLGAYLWGIILSCFWVLTCEAYATPFLPHQNFCLLIVTSIQPWAVAVVMGPFPLQSGQQTATAHRRNIQSTAEVTSTSNTIYHVPSKNLIHSTWHLTCCLRRTGNNEFERPNSWQQEKHTKLCSDLLQAPCPRKRTMGRMEKRPSAGTVRLNVWTS